MPLEYVDRMLAAREASSKLCRTLAMQRVEGLQERQEKTMAKNRVNMVMEEDGTLTARQNWGNREVEGAASIAGAQGNAERWRKQSAGRAHGRQAILGTRRSYEGRKRWAGRGTRKRTADSIPRLRLPSAPVFAPSTALLAASLF